MFFLSALGSFPHLRANVEESIYTHLCIYPSSTLSFDCTISYLASSHLSMAPDRKPYANRGRGNGKSYDTGFKEDAARTHADRTALLLAKAREANGGNDVTPIRNTIASPQPSSHQQEAIALPALIKSLANPQLKGDALSIKEAIPIAGKLARAKLNTTHKLSLLNGFILEEAGITSEVEQHKIMIAFGVKRVGSSKEAEKAKGRSALEALSAKVRRGWVSPHDRLNVQLRTCS